MKKITKAVIPAAGLGTRFLPFTKSMPKEMLPIIDIPNIQHLICEAVKSGIKDILLIISENKKIIKDYFSDDKVLYDFLISKGKNQEADMVKEVSSLANIHYVYQDKPKGLGDAILYAEDFASGEDFAVLLGDDLIDYSSTPATKELLDAYYKTNGSLIVGCKEIDEKDLHKFGVVKPKTKVEYPFFEIVDFVEKPKDISLAPSKVASLGRYVLTSDIFASLKETKAGVGGEVQLTDGIKNIINSKKVYVCLFTPKRYDIGDKFGYIEATIDYALKRDELRNKLLPYLKKIVEENK